MDGQQMNRWTSLASFLLVLLFAAAADGLMEALDLVGFLAAGTVVMGLAWGLAYHRRPEEGTS